MMFGFQCGSRFYIKGGHFLGRFCVLKTERFKFDVLKNLLVVGVGAPQDRGRFIMCLVPGSLTSNVEPVMFKDCRKWRYINSEMEYFICIFRSK